MCLGKVQEDLGEHGRGAHSSPKHAAIQPDPEPLPADVLLR